MFCILVRGLGKCLGHLLSIDKAIQKGVSGASMKQNHGLCFFSFWDLEDNANIDSWLLSNWSIGDGINFFGMLKVFIHRIFWNVCE